MSRGRWTPVRRGITYCSPGCGYGCTYAAFRAATERAEALAKALGPEWKPNVWENLGWHYSAILNEGRPVYVEVYPRDGGSYWIDARLPDQHCAETSGRHGINRLVAELLDNFGAELRIKADVVAALRAKVV